MSDKLLKRIDREKSLSFGQIDWADVIIANMEEKLENLVELTGVKNNVFELKSIKGKVEILDQNPLELWSDRVDEIVSIARELETEEVKFEAIAYELFLADGWSFTKDSMRTPLWMFDVQELKRDELAKREGLRWLAVSSSVIK